MENKLLKIQYKPTPPGTRNVKYVENATVKIVTPHCPKAPCSFCNTFAWFWHAQSKTVERQLNSGIRRIHANTVMCGTTDRSRPRKCVLIVAACAAIASISMPVPVNAFWKKLKLSGFCNAAIAWSCAPLPNWSTPIREQVAATIWSQTDVLICIKCCIGL